MTDWNDRNDPEVVLRLSRKCVLCGQPPNSLCTSMPISNHRLPNRLVHFGR